MKKKFIVLLSSLLVVSALFVFTSQKAYAACSCVRSVAPAGPSYDSQGLPIPSDAYGKWTSDTEEPFCPPITECTPAAVGCSSYAAGKVCPVCVTQPCNVYTQGYVKTWFRVPTLGDLVGNIIRLMFFIAGLYALVLLLLGGFEWVSSGGEEKKLTSARGKILNAIIGLVVMVAVLTLVILLEQVVFGGKVCLGISCPINMGDLSIIK
ncbi:hypothetical protein KBB12_02020 [Candidatus Woesebacteria bacterium]|nr:hypothetical protein [Candidatus Woesebacteria bacterium]